jgi:hypothetical protein
VSKRHQSSRRKSYGRRQHEVRERLERHPFPERTDLMPESFEGAVRFDDHGVFGFGSGPRRLGFALGD